MRRARMYLILGVWVAVLPYLGFPYSWKSVLSVLTGLALIYLSYTMYLDYKKENSVEEFDNFRENSAFDNKKVEMPADEAAEAPSEELG